VIKLITLSSLSPHGRRGGNSLVEGKNAVGVVGSKEGIKVLLRNGRERQISKKPSLIY